MKDFINLLQEKFWIKLHSVTFIICYTTLILIFYNIDQWKIIYGMYGNKEIMKFLIVIYVHLFLNILLLLIFGYRKTLKAICIFILFFNSIALYFIENFHIYITPDIVRNFYNSDINEAKSFFSKDLLYYLFYYCILPSILILRTKIHFFDTKKEITIRIITFILIIIPNLSSPIYQLKRNWAIAKNVLPTNYLLSNTELLITNIINLNRSDFSLDMKIRSNDKLAVIFILGESARAKNFSLYGYHRNTNPFLSHENLYIFHNTNSCSTSTLTSVECIFSHLERKEFLNNQNKYKNAIQSLRKSGIRVLWKDNSTGCRLTLSKAAEELEVYDNKKSLCNSYGCYDEILANGIDKTIESLKNNKLFLILHQSGSHWKYHERYPKEFEIFQPICKLSNPKECNQKELVNNYDNSIVYTDYVIHRVIEQIKSIKIPAVVIYASDHGESLGENGVYIHGYEYDKAPREQKEIPFMIWFSPTYEKKYKINKQCALGKQSYSHDNIFHTILGLFHLDSVAYKKSLDIFADCITRK